MSELEQAKQRISELAGMLNEAHRAAKLQVEDERDACERALRFLLESAQSSQPSNPQRVEALRHAVETIVARKDASVRMVSEMAHGTMIGEFVSACVKEALEHNEKLLAPLLEAVEKAAEDNDALREALQAYRDAIVA